MVRSLTGAALAVLVSAFVYAGEGKEAKEVTGTVKSVSGSEFTVTSGEKDMTFSVVSNETTVVAKGGSHKLDQLKSDGKPAVLSEFLSENQIVAVKYYEKEGKLVAKKVHVRKP